MDRHSVYNPVFLHFFLFPIRHSQWVHSPFGVIGAGVGIGIDIDIGVEYLLNRIFPSENPTLASREMSNAEH